MTSTPSAKQSHTGIVQKTRQSLPPPFPRSLASAATGDGQQRLFLPPPRPTLTPGTGRFRYTHLQFLYIYTYNNI
jgi:hypothetical protein